MCGILAVYSSNTGELPSLETCRRAVEAVAHRGPDHLGEFRAATCYLGHTRLSIIGLESDSNQPFVFDHLAMTFNGEIFNFIELRKILISEGYSFLTGSDTEVVIKAFHRWGVECFSLFNGMWALAIYDARSRRFFVSRDRFGQKPLFAVKNEGTFIFCSEPQQLVDLVDLAPDLGLIQMFLKEGTYDGHGRTFFENVREFPKAHVWQIEPSGRIESTRYWSYWAGPIKKTASSTFVEFAELLKDSVALRLRADVSSGVLLSGGIDSTVIASLACEILGTDRRFPAFTYAAHDESDESSFAGQVAEGLGIPLSIRQQDCDGPSFLSRLRKLVWHMGRGHSSPAIVSVDYLYESVSNEGVRVALDGQGADELLGGYKTYQPIMIVSSLLRRDLSLAYKFIKDLRDEGALGMLTLFLRNILPAPLKSVGRMLYGYEEFFALLKSLPEISEFESFDSTIAPNRNMLNRYLIWHHNLGLENLLYYGDIVSMKNSVENRAPYMDHRLVDFVFSHDEALKVEDAHSKAALRKLGCYARFRKCLERPKIGFASNIRGSTKRDMILELSTSRIFEWPIFTPKLFNFLRQGGFEHPKFERLLFRLYQVHLWTDLFVEGRGRPSYPTGTLRLSDIHPRTSSRCLERR